MTTTQAGVRTAIVPHTHWDREWYEPFQTYRLRLVQLLDEFLPHIERDPGYRHFLLDGQTAVVDDYLEVRPEAEERIRRLVAAGRLSVGPWKILMDEFMVSGETIVRNLQAGLRRAAELGGSMPVGYLPDMFGHVAQMPQILRLAGLEHAVVWRGVPREIAATGFWWQAPDGSRVRTEYLYGSYSNGRDIPRDPALLVERARSYQEELGPARLDGMLLMNGTDHQVPQPWLGEVVARANAEQDDFLFEVTSLADYLADQPVEGLPTWTGELRSGARANVLMGVASNRVDVHQAAAAAERAVERRAEPLAALGLAPDEYPTRLLELAWHNLVVNSAHDSSCACSHDEVVEQVLVRYREARQIGDGIVHDVKRRLAREIDAPAGATVVMNPSPRSRSGLVEVPVTGTGPLHFVDDGQPVIAQVVAEDAGERFAAQVVGSKLGWILDTLRGEEFAGTPVAGFEIEERDAPHSYDVAVRGAGPGDERVDVGGLRERLVALADEAEGQGTEASFLVRALHPVRRRALLHAEAVPGFGWRTYEARDGAPPEAVAPRVTAEGTTLRNECLEVQADATTGTFSLRTADGLVAEGLNRYVNGGDGGDTYNYSPPDDDVVVDGVAEGTTPDIRVVEAGPLRARLLVTSRHRWPTHAEGDVRKCHRRADALADVEIRTTLELRAGEPLVRVRCEFDNPSRDQRLRAHFPVPAPATGSDAECAFAVVHRGLTAEGGPNEVGLPTFPSRRFVDAGDGDTGLAIVHDGLLEYEVVSDDRGSEIALTLLRSVGYLSRIEPQLRPNPAGPPIAVEGAQMLGHREVEYAVHLHAGTWEDAGLYDRADEVLVPLERAPAAGGGGRPKWGSLLRVDGAEVSAVYREAGALMVRVFNPVGRAAPVRIELGDGPASGWVVDLRGRPRDPFSGELTLRPGEIVTAQIRA